MPKELTQKINFEGEISFAQFMDLTLYAPNLGYYSKHSESKDYYTNADVHPIFAEILAHFFAKILDKNFKEDSFYLVELGCGNGKLSRQILKVFSQDFPSLYRKLKFIGIEKSEARIKTCRNMEREFEGKVTFLNEFNFKDQSLSGIIYSNEFFDALPVHRVLNKEGKLYEVWVNSDLKENLKPLSSSLENYFSWVGAQPLSGCFGEAHLAAREWIRKCARSLSKGLLLTIDYGFPSEELYTEFRTEGTALCAYQHKTNRDFYNHLGEQDITAHLNFTVLKKEAEAFGFTSEALKTQYEFLLEHGLEKMVEGSQKTPLNEMEKLKRSLALRSLIHPEGMGGTFKVLAQSKGL